MAETGLDKPVGSRRVVYSSPKRVLIRSLRISRDNWKAKHAALQSRVKRFRVQAYDACQSRDGWRQRAESAERELKQLRSQAARQVAAEAVQKK